MSVLETISLVVAALVIFTGGIVAALGLVVWFCRWVGVDNLVVNFRVDR